MNSEWLREQIAFAIFNNTNPPRVRDALNLQNISRSLKVTSQLDDGLTITTDYGLDWRLNRPSFLKLADVAIKAMDAADADGSAYEPAE